VSSGILREVLTNEAQLGMHTGRYGDVLRAQGDRGQGFLRQLRLALGDLLFPVRPLDALLEPQGQQDEMTMTRISLNIARQP